MSANYNYVNRLNIKITNDEAKIKKRCGRRIEMAYDNELLMTYDDELRITYGLGYAFEKSKLLIVSEIEEKVISKKEINIIEEINAINKFKEKLYNKSDLKFPKDYIISVEEALEEKLSKVIPIITSIKAKNTEKQDHLMDEYIKRDISQMRLKREGYIQKDSNLIKDYLDKCAEDLDTKIRNEEKKSLKYNKFILKVILTASFGNEFSSFLSKQGQAGIIIEKHKLAEKQLENQIKENYLIKKKYNELDFLNLLLFLEEWQKKHFEWDEKYTSLLFSINKDGKKYRGKKSEIKDFVISFIKEKNYLYFPFAKYTEDNVFITLNDERYCNKINNKQSYTLLERKETNLYELISKNYKEIDLESNSELGYLLTYKNDDVYISVVTYNTKSEKVSFINQYEDLKPEMIEALENHFIV